MFGAAPGIYIRAPFPVTDPALFDVLKLRMQFDDGFVAYINGQEVARRARSGISGLGCTGYRQPRSQPRQF